MTRSSNNTTSLDVNHARRRFLKTGIAGSVLLSLASSGALLTACNTTSDDRCDACLWLTSHDRVLLMAVVPVMLQDALPTAPEQSKKYIEEIIRHFDETVAYFSPVVRKEIRQLFDLLEFSLTRVLLTGVSSWEKADASDIHSFLSSWENSRFGLLRAGYSALHDLICGAWYANPHSWTKINYPGPPNLN